MKGYLKMLAGDFDTWNNAATVKANDIGMDCDSYTSPTPDTDPQYVWARVEHDFVEGDIKTKEDAAADGMIVLTEE